MFQAINDPKLLIEIATSVRMIHSDPSHSQLKLGIFFTWNTLNEPSNYSNPKTTLRISAECGSSATRIYLGSARNW